MFVRYWLARCFLSLIGWKPEGDLPKTRKFVLVSAPHTSNFDAILLVALGYMYGIKLNWVGKHTLFRWPLGYWMRAWGGIPVDRRSRNNMVEQLAEEFANRKQLILAVPPEGTRSRAERWKTGFYYIALQAKVPIVLGFLDYRRKRGGFGPTFEPSGDIEADMEIIRNFYKDITGKHPEDFGPISIEKPTEVSQSKT
jgi:1-acyl-sn-glycerol-3-phosphate acyltransferase